MSGNRGNKNTRMGAESSTKSTAHDPSSTNAADQRHCSKNPPPLQPPTAHMKKGSSSGDASYDSKVKSSNTPNQQGASSTQPRSHVAVHGQLNRQMTSSVNVPAPTEATPKVQTPSGSQQSVSSTKRDAGTGKEAAGQYEGCSIEAALTFLNRVEELRVDAEEAKKELSSMQQQIKSLEENNQALQNKLKATEDDHAKEMSQVQKSKDDLQRTNENYKNKCDKSNKDLTDATSALSQLKDLLQHSKENESKLTSEIKRRSTELTNMKNDLQRTATELSECKSRLSRLMSNKLTENNPQIADLSDTNRPTKLAEKHSELYDNQWTDAFEELEEMYKSDEQAIQILLNVLLNVHQFCVQHSAEQTNQLIQVACLGQCQGHQLPDSLELKKQTKEFRKYTVDLSIQAAYQVYFAQTQPREPHLFANLRVCKFIEECVKLCWLMNVQDPAVVFAPLPPVESEFKADWYRPYTNSGSHVQYLVWPALLLNEGGPLLIKGVAQGYSIVNRSVTSNHDETRHPLTNNSQSARNSSGNGNNTMCTVVNEGRNESASHRSQMSPGSYPYSAQDLTEGGNYHKATDMKHAIASQSNTNNKGYVNNPFDELVKEFDNQSSVQTNLGASLRSKPTDQPTNRPQTFSSSVKVPIEGPTQMFVPSEDEMNRFLKILEDGEDHCRKCIGENTFNEFYTYYTQVYLPNMQLLM